MEQDDYKEQIRLKKLEEAIERGEQLKDILNDEVF